MVKLADYNSGMYMLLNSPKNGMVVGMFIVMILTYFAGKNRANGPAVFSSSRPRASFDSPSVKSNGGSNSFCWHREKSNYGWASRWENLPGVFLCSDSR